MNDTVLLPDGSLVRMGNNAPAEGLLKGAWAEFGSTPEQRLIPRGEWDAMLTQYTPGPMHTLLPPVHFQNGVGQCNADSTTALVEFCRAMQGLPYVQLSAPDLYDRINNGRDDGSMLEDAMREIMTNGVGTAATSGTLWKNGNWKGPAPKAERARNRVLEAYICPTFGHCYSAVLQGFGLSTGIMWHPNYTPGADGWLPRGQGRAGGHAIAGYKPAKRGNEYGIWHLNSWGKTWGDGGRFVIPESAYAGGAVGGWWAVRSVTDEGGVIPEEQK